MIDGGRADGGQHHQQVDADLSFRQQFEGVDGGEGAAEDVREDEEPIGERFGRVQQAHADDTGDGEDPAADGSHPEVVALPPGGRFLGVLQRGQYRLVDRLAEIEVDLSDGWTGGRTIGSRRIGGRGEVGHGDRSARRRKGNSE